MSLSYEKKDRIAMIVGKMNGGGVEAVVMNHLKYINKDLFQIDVVVDNDSKMIPYKDFENMGINVFKVAPYQNLFRYIKDLNEIYKLNDYNIVHSHINSLNIVPLSVSKKYIKHRISHNHSTAAPGEYKKNILKYLLKVFSKHSPTHFMAPSYSAGEWLFGNKVANNELFILKNAIEINKFEFDKDIRNKIRKKYDIKEEDYLIGNVGRFVWQKNQGRLLEIYNDILRNIPNSKLMIIGEGPLYSSLIKYCKDNNIESNVLFISNTEEIAEYYQAMDLFLFPTRYEGLGNVLVEAQASGLPVVASDIVPNEAIVSDNYFSISLNEKNSIWSDKVKEIYSFKINRKENCSINKQKLIENDYDIEYSSKRLENFYLKILEAEG